MIRGKIWGNMQKNIARTFFGILKKLKIVPLKSLQNEYQKVPRFA